MGLYSRRSVAGVGVCAVLPWLLDTILPKPKDGTHSRCDNLLSPSRKVLGSSSKKKNAAAGGAARGEDCGPAEEKKNGATGWVARSVARGPAVGRRKKRRAWQLDGGTRCGRRARGYDYCIVAGWVAHGADLRALGGPAEEKKNAGAGWVACGKDLWAREGPRDRNPRTLVCLFPKQETFGVPCLKNDADHGGWMACGLAGCRRRLDRQRRLDGLYGRWMGG